MTNPEILKLAETCGFDMYANENGDCWECWEHQLLKFAEAIYEKGYDEGTVDAYERQFRIQNEIRD